MGVVVAPAVVVTVASYLLTSSPSSQMVMQKRSACDGITRCSTLSQDRATNKQ